MTDRGEKRQTWYFTFGASHEHANRFVVFNDRTCDEARELMVAAFGLRWAFQYGEYAWLVPLHRRDPDGPRVTQAEKYGLTQLDPGEFPTAESPDNTRTSATPPLAAPESASKRSGGSAGNE